jgi:hypothetical protein
MIIFLIERLLNKSAKSTLAKLYLLKVERLLDVAVDLVLLQPIVSWCY